MTGKSRSNQSVLITPRFKNTICKTVTEKVKMGKFSSLRSLVKVSGVGELLEGSGAALGQEPENIDEALAQAEAPEYEVHVDDVVPAAWKLYYDEDKVLALMESIQRLGQIDAIAVTPIGGRVQVLAGNHRREAVRRLGDRLVRVKLFDLAPDVAIDIAIASNAQRSDPNPLELTHLILSSLSIKLGIPQDEVVRWFHRFGNDKQSVLLTEEWRIITETFTAVCQFSPSTFRVDYLPLLSLPSCVLDAVKSGFLQDHTKAKAIAKLRHDSGAMGALLQEAIANPDLSLRDINERVKQAKPSGKLDVWHQVGQVQQRIKSRKLALKDPNVRERVEKAIASFKQKIGEILGEE